MKNIQIKNDVDEKVKKDNENNEGEGADNFKPKHGY